MKNEFKNLFNEKFYTKETEKTYERWYKSMQEFNNFEEFNMEEFTLFKNSIKNQVIECKNIKISSLCSHHLFPYKCEVNILYIPNENYCGLSKLPRVCFHYSRRPCSQEELTSNIFNFLKKALEPVFLEVEIINGEHTCSSCRGIGMEVNYNTKISMESKNV